MTVGKPVAVYVRTAFEDGKGAGLACQEQDIRQWARCNGYVVNQVYADTGSGNEVNRPGLQQLLADARKGVFEVVLMRDPARLFRNLRLFREYHTTLTTELGVTVVFINL